MTGALVPPPDEVTRDWWEATRRRALVLQRCTACGRIQHPPRAVCTACGSTGDPAWVDASGAGTVDSCTVVRRAPSPEFTPPYVVARVRLREGPVILTNVTGTEPYAVAPGDPVTLVWQPLPDGRALPVFVPERDKE